MGLQMFSLIVVLASPYFSFDHFVTHGLSSGINDMSKLKRHIVLQGDSSGNHCDGPGPLSSSLSHLQRKPLLAIRDGFSDVDGTAHNPKLAYSLAWTIWRGKKSSFSQQKKKRGRVQYQTVAIKVSTDL